jgi:putative spermidine/putrescine transport system permease protein
MRILATVLFALGVLFLFFPVIIVAPMSFSGDRFLTFPPQSWGLTWYRAYFGDPVWMAATMRSLRIAAVASLIGTIAGTAAVVGLGRLAQAPRGALSGLFLAPAIVPNVIIALGLFILTLRIGSGQGEWVLVLAHATLALPFVIMIVGAAWRQTDPALERAARVCGAGPLRAFVTGTLPSIMPAVVAAAIFAFFVSFDELTVALFVMGGAETLPVRLWNDLRFEINPTVAAVSTFFVVMTTAAMGLAEMLRRRAVRQRE